MSLQVLFLCALCSTTPANAANYLLGKPNLPYGTKDMNSVSPVCGDDGAKQQRDTIDSSKLY